MISDPAFRAFCLIAPLSLIVAFGLFCLIHRMDFLMNDPVLLPQGLLLSDGHVVASVADSVLLMLCLMAAFWLFFLLQRLILGSKAPCPRPDHVELTDGYVLCQDCGHVEPYTADRHQGREACSQCGGDFCGCTACSELARMALQFQDPAEASQVKDTPASRTRRAESEASEHRTGEDVAKRILDPPPTSQPP